MLRILSVTLSQLVVFNFDDVCCRCRCCRSSESATAVANGASAGDGAGEGDNYGGEGDGSGDGDGDGDSWGQMETWQWIPTMPLLSAGRVGEG